MIFQLSPIRHGYFNPQIFTEYHGLSSRDFDEVLKDRSFPVLSAKAKLSFASAVKMEICAASAHRQNHFAGMFPGENQ